jgi:dienelactone hydrolase
MKLHYAAAALLGVVIAAGSAQAAIKVQTVDYKQGDTALEGWLVYDDAAQGKRPGVVVYPQWMGPSADEKTSTARACVRIRRRRRARKWANI